MHTHTILFDSSQFDANICWIVNETKVVIYLICQNHFHRKCKRLASNTFLCRQISSIYLAINFIDGDSLLSSASIAINWTVFQYNWCIQIQKWLNIIVNYIGVYLIVWLKRSKLNSNPNHWNQNVYNLKFSITHGISCGSSVVWDAVNYKHNMRCHA